MTWAEFIAGLPAYAYQPQAMTPALARTFTEQAWARVLGDIWRQSEPLPDDALPMQYQGAVNAAAMVIIAAWERDVAAQRQWGETYYDQITPARAEWAADPLNPKTTPQMKAETAQDVTP